MRRLLLVLLLALLAGRLPGQEDRFDPPLDGVYLGISARVEDGKAAVAGVDPGSAAESAGLRAGDDIVRLGTASGFPDREAFVQTVRSLRRGEAVEVEVEREGARRLLRIVPDPGVMADHYALLERLRGSGFLSGRPDFGAFIADFQASVPAALRAASRTSEAYEALNRGLGGLGTSHTAVIPPWTYKNLFAGEEDGREGYSLGLILERLDGPEGPRFFAMDLLDGGPAAEAGLLRGDEVVEVNGIPSRDSPRRALAGYEARRTGCTLQVEKGERVALRVRRQPGGPILELTAAADRPLSGLRASSESLRRLVVDGRRIAYLHLWNLLSPRLPALVEEALLGDGVYTEGLLLDVRGRGGQVQVTELVLRALRSSRRPLVLLIDRETRSAKEILAFRLKGQPQVSLIGERTAGAVLPGGYSKLPGGAMVMLPADPKGIEKLTSGASLEGRGVDPDLAVERGGPYSAGADPILDAGLKELLFRLAGLPRRMRA
jgi:carboxyl-terminal processing protease